MLKPRMVRHWYRIHKWASLICMAFLLMACLTGLPLVFQDEIGNWLHPTAYAYLPPDAPRLNLDRLAARSRQMYPGQIVTSVFVDDDEPQVLISMAPSWAAVTTDPGSIHILRFDARTGILLQQRKTSGHESDFVDIVLSLHRELFAGLLGELFMGCMALLFVIAIVSGVVLYGPFMKKLDFGTVRKDRSTGLKWLDLHNLLGIVVAAWMLVVGATGVMNELEAPLFALWQHTDIAVMVAPWRGKTPPTQNELSSVQAAFNTAQRALPGMTVVTAVYPGGNLGSPHHYLLFARGATPVTSQLFSPVLVDARTGKLTAVLQEPWYLRALELSRPLHFGDYGGLPLKIIWALFDVALIFVLISGLYLWLSRRKTPVEDELDRLVKLEELSAEGPPVEVLAR